MLAVIQTGGKQYKVQPGSRIKIEKVEGETGKQLLFSEVLLFHDDQKIEIGTPTVKGVTVEGKILKQGKAAKVIIFKYRPKARSRVKKGHRQRFTEVEITKIVA